MTTPTKIDVNGIELDKLDDTLVTTLTPTTGLTISYDLTTSAKLFRISETGAYWTDGVNTFNTSLNRLCAIEQAFQAVTLPPNSTTLEINKTLNFDDQVGNVASIGLVGSDLVMSSTAGVVKINDTLDMSGNDIINAGTITATNLNGAISVNNTNANATHYLTFVDSNATGNRNLQADSGISCNPNANSISATTFIGALQGNADSATNASNVNITSNNTNATYYPVFSAGTGNQPLLVDDTTTPFSINPNTNALNFGSTIKLDGTGGSNRVGLGINAGLTNQGGNSIAIGINAGNVNQSTSCVAIGNASGNASQGSNAVAIGVNAGSLNQGANAVAIGNLAGQTSQTAGSIALNASGVALNPTNAGCYINPIRNVNPTTLLGYDATSRELTYSSTIGGTITFSNPPTCSTSASTTNQLTNWDNFSSWVSYTPTWTSDGGAGTPTYQYQTGYYCKIGKMVMFSVDIRTTDMGTLPAGVLRLTLPFQNNSLVSSCFTIGFFQFTTNNLDVITFCEASATGTRFFYKTASSPSYANFLVNDGNVLNFTCRISGTYMSI